MRLSLLYRGSLASCNYSCSYCPFAKRRDDRAALATDAAALQRFCHWLSTQSQHEFAIMFTPWGEALVRRYYQQALIELSQQANICRIVVQTNLSARLDWLAQAATERVQLWATYHPQQVKLADFITQCLRAQDFGVSLSVGVVGRLPEHAAAISALREALPPELYLWINAYDDDPEQYSAEQIAWCEAIDPWFRHNLHHYPSLGQPCRAGHEVLSIDAEGTAYPCHFIRQPLGNLYAPGFLDSLYPRRCTQETCGCYIGYSHMPGLELEQIYGDGLLARIPKPELWPVIKNKYNGD